MIKHKVLFIIGFFISLIITAQDTQPVQFSFNKESKGKGEFLLTITAKPVTGVKLFSIQKMAEDFPVNSVISVDSSVKMSLQDSITEIGNLHTEKDKSLNNTSIKFYSDSLQWKQKIKLNTGDSIRILGKINYYYKKGESVEAAEQRISMQFSYTEELISTKNIPATDGDFGQKSWIILLLLGMGAGLLAFITPCV